MKSCKLLFALALFAISTWASGAVISSVTKAASRTDRIGSTTAPQEDVNEYYQMLQDWKLAEAVDRDAMNALRGETAMDGNSGSDLIGKFEY